MPVPPRARHNHGTGKTTSWQTKKPEGVEPSRLITRLADKLVHCPIKLLKQSTRCDAGWVRQMMTITAVNPNIAAMSIVFILIAGNDGGGISPSKITGGSGVGKRRFVFIFNSSVSCCFAKHLEPRVYLCLTNWLICYHIRQIKSIA